MRWVPGARSTDSAHASAVIGAPVSSAPAVVSTRVSMRCSPSTSTSGPEPHGARTGALRWIGTFCSSAAPSTSSLMPTGRTVRR